MIQISESASEKLQALHKEEGAPEGAMLRVVVKRGGCSGWSYKMEFDSSVNDKDKVFESNGSKIVVDDKSLLYLLGLTLDYEGGLNGKGFIFSNPNASKTCGCGSSFAV